MRARARLAVAAVDSASDGLGAVVVQDQVGAASRAIQPALDAILRNSDGGADSMLGGGAVGVSGGSGNITLVCKAFAEFVAAETQRWGKVAKESGATVD